MTLNTIEQAIADIREGKMVILVDDEDRENEGDLVIAAEMAIPQAINFMATHARGLICLSLAPEFVERLGLRQMADQNTSPYGTAFTVSVDAAEGISTGVSAADRARTIAVAISEQFCRGDLVSPGHIFPLKAKPGGVLTRSGQTEGSIDLARLAGLKSAAVICEILNDDGTMARLPQLLAFRETHGVSVVSVADLIRFRIRHESFIRVVAQSTLPTEFGELSLTVYENQLNDLKHVVLAHGKMTADEPALVRVHRQAPFPDVFGRFTLQTDRKVRGSLALIAKEGSGMLLYIQSQPHPSVVGAIPERQRVLRDPGLEKLRPFYDFGVGAQILRDQGLRKLRVITNNPMSFKGLSGFGIDIVEWVPFELTESSADDPTAAEHKG